MKEKEKNADEDEEKKQIKTKQMSKTHRPIPGNEERGLREDAVPAPYRHQHPALQDVVRQSGQVLRHRHRREGPTSDSFCRYVRPGLGTLNNKNYQYYKYYTD